MNYRSRAGIYFTGEISVGSVSVGIVNVDRWSKIGWVGLLSFLILFITRYLGLIFHIICHIDTPGDNFRKYIFIYQYILHIYISR